MPAKAGAVKRGVKKVSTVGKPAWVSEELWELGQNTRALVDRFKSPSDSNIGSSGYSQYQVI
jgi:hypothetical protein